MGGGGSELTRLSGGENCMLGIAAGMATKAINYPLLNWKNCSQQSLPISFNPKVVYRGLPMAMMNLGGTTGVQFGTTGFFQKMIKGAGYGPDVCVNGGAFLGGLASGIPCSLWELTMIQQQRFGGSILGTPVRIAKDHGAGMLMRGLTCTLGRESLFTLAMLGITPTIQLKLVEDYKLDKNVGLAAGALIGSILSATLTHPMDTIKTCMQGDLEGKKYTTVKGTGAELIKDNGVAKGLFKGLGWRITLIATTFFLVNKFKQVLAPVMFPSKDEPEKK
mmetsp:Transcript_44310/g.108294  ORF Transcript_44310/g.108294 Transcript_44310/m.108294 type:complete len:277 (+) Transcript_44310:47-877(+)|eukprot:CAMPEP_0206241854 /NCGR_PEP_ID=MMETSP0047_2-20121206/16733_1 /ASSEMBLY_ACC=CAM_ASM_000192 /TAXON_ID=195065 /ORGANISM="Chroomonas mesostigmatica_cf, Strain CCMP1168" /LENGTH=276 /DNA_ID=CAMNT_0053666809 /DNA_START=32 /DNA_END=862 /DNA_ORIENTATION=+